jgi:DNA topoisomerase-1
MLLSHPARAARDAGLRYVTDRQPGMTRERVRSGFRYRGARGQVIRSKRVIRRIEALAIPPAWTSVWICSDPRGHIQATGLDARGRKQYRYHPRWGQARNLGKFETLAEFARALPAIRRRVARDLRKSGLPRDKVVACIVHLLDRTLIRIGNDAYARENKSYGLTTIRNTHARVRAGKVRFSFRGKGGKVLDVSVDNPRVARIVRRCQELPGQELFEYIDDDGARRDVGSSDVNDYLAGICGSRFTAKDFRTWGGTVSAAEFFHRAGRLNDRGRKAMSKAGVKRLSMDAVRCAAEVLQNTPTVCRKFYVHPQLFELHLAGKLHEAFARSEQSRRPAGLSSGERAVLRLIRMAKRNGRA